MIQHVPRKTVSRTERQKRQKMDMLCPGLSLFTSLIGGAFALPHPAFGRHEFNGVIRASSVASVTLDLLESISAVSAVDAKGVLPTGDIFVIRLSRSGKPQRIVLSRNPSTREATVKPFLDAKSDVTLRDKPIECPEYICFYCHPQHTSGKGEGRKNLPMLFKEVVVDDGNSDKSLSIARLEKLKEAEPRIFSRSFAFVLSVKRNRRLFYTYNWNPHVVKKYVLPETMLSKVVDLLCSLIQYAFFWSVHIESLRACRKWTRFS